MSIRILHEEYICYDLYQITVGIIYKMVFIKGCPLIYSSFSVRYLQSITHGNIKWTEKIKKLTLALVLTFLTGATSTFLGFPWWFTTLSSSSSPLNTRIRIRVEIIRIRNRLWENWIRIRGRAKEYRARIRWGKKIKSRSDLQLR